ncbi:MAG: hypothetical protein Q9168_005131, partial [Polycauliona sp. 1 TL-2023]
MKEYILTGETPLKTQYRFPTTLPRTEAHERLLMKGFPTSNGNASTTSLIPGQSPSKSIIYTDIQDSEPSSASTPSKISTKPTPATNTNTTTTTTTGLRELDMNITSNNRLSDPPPSTTTSSNNN